jgi:ABC-type Na+ efflux pump permease subunit
MKDINQFILDNLILVLLAITAIIWLKPYFIKKKTITKPKPTAQPSTKLQAILKFIQLWPEVYMIPLLLLIAVALNYMLLVLWPEAIFFGPEHIQKLIYKSVAAFLAYFLFFLRDRLDFPEAWHWYSSDDRLDEYKLLTPWQKRTTYFWRMSVFVFCFAIV